MALLAHVSFAPAPGRVRAPGPHPAVPTGRLELTPHAVERTAEHEFSELAAATPRQTYT
jgi:hypothetical protein